MSEPSFDTLVAKARTVPLQDVLTRHSNIKLSGRGGNLTGPGPQCGGTDRFALSLRKAQFNCLGCGAKGTGAIDLETFLDPGVDFQEIVTRLAGKPSPEKKKNGKVHDESAPVRVGEFIYENENGEPLFRVRRFDRHTADGSPSIGKDGKTEKFFVQSRPDPNRAGRWLKGIEGVRRVLYRLPELLEDLAHGREIIIVEGERKVDLLRSWSVPATCNSGGAEKWKPGRSAFLAGADVVILPDNDPAGRKHLDNVAASLKAVGAGVRVLDLPGLGPKSDIVDWAAAGGTAEQLHALVEREVKPWKPKHGDDRHEGDAQPDADNRTTIQIKLGQLPQLVDEMEAAILAANRGLYKRGGQIVRIGEIELLGADEKKTTALAIIEPNEHALLEDASASAHFVKYNKQESKWLPADPPMAVVKAWQARASLHLPLLSGVISTPLILPTGRIIERPGYDESTGFYFDPLGTVFPPMHSTPTQDDARDALDLLKGLIEEFPFIDEASHAVALSGLLTSVARRALDFAFMHAVTQGKTAEEFEKRLDAHLLKGVGHMAIDNVSRPLEGDRLCQILTQTFLDIRPLGTSGNTTVQPDAFVSATGTKKTCGGARFCAQWTQKKRGRSFENFARTHSRRCGRIGGNTLSRC